MLPIDQRSVSPEMIRIIDEAKVIAVLVIDELKDAVPLANALMAGGVNAIELTLRTPVALDAAKAIKIEVPGVTVGLGTVLTIEQVKAAKEIDVDFAVSPGCNPRIISAAQDHGLSFAPGIVTPSDIEIALELGCRILKFFPAETSGGIKHLESLAAPYNYLNLRFIPLGGVSLANARSYFESPLITAIGGSWIAKRSMIQAGDWETITANAKAIRTLINQIKN